MNSFLLFDLADLPSGSGRWITRDGALGKPNYYFRLWRDFTLEAVPECLRLRVAADGRYQVWVNGIAVGVGPVRGTRELNFYDLYDVAAALRPGRNTLAVLVQCMNMPNFLTMPVEPALWLELDGVLGSDAEWLTAEATDWRADVQTHTFQTGYCEWRDYRLEPVGWQRGVGVAAWSNARLVAASSELYRRKLLVRDVPAMAESVYYPVGLPIAAAIPPWNEVADVQLAARLTTEPHTALGDRLRHPAALLRVGGDEEWLEVAPAADGSGAALVLDFEQEIIGRFAIEVEAPAGTIIDVCCEEELYQERLRGEHLTAGYHFVDRYICRAGRLTVGGGVNERGFRMLQLNLRNFAQPVKIFAVKAFDAHYPYVERGAFFSSDWVLNRIWDVCVETLKKCTTDVFIDCPWRERAFWVNDLVVENQTSLNAFGASAVHRRAFELAFSQTRDDGLVDGVCPCSQEHGLTLVATNLFLPLMLESYLLYSGDAATVKRYLPEMRRILETFAQWSDAAGLVQVPARDGVWNFFDWSYQQNGREFEGKPTPMLNLFYVLALQCCERLAAALQLDLPVADYRERAERAWRAVFAVFGRDADGYLSDTVGTDWRSELPHALAMLTGRCSGTELAACQRALRDEAVLQPEYYLHFFIFRALDACGANAMTLERIRRHWAETIRTGTPTLWESGIHHKGKAAFAESGSLCHGFGTAPLEFMQTVILGIRPLTPGFGRFRIAPETFDLTDARGRVPTPAGNIEVAWRRASAADDLTLTVRIPRGLTGVLDDGRELGAGRHELTLAAGRIAVIGG